MKQVEKYMENLGELKRVIEVDSIVDVHNFYIELEKTNRTLEEDLESMRTLNKRKKDDLLALTEKLTTAQ